MKFPAAFNQKVASFESHPRMETFLHKLDRFATLLCNRTYLGTNPALATTYAPLRAAMITITAITLFTLIFGFLIPMESAAIAKGSVVVLSKRKTVQHLEGGIVKAILVEDGQLVKQGQPLMEISDIAPKANREIAQSEVWAEQAAEIRIQALHENADSITFPEAMQKAAEETPELKKTMQAQAELFASQRETQAGKLNSLQQRIAQYQEEIIGLRAQISSAEGQLKFIREEINAVRPLVKEGLATKPRLLALERQSEELLGSRGQNMALIAKAEQGITQAKMDIINQKNDFTTQLAEEYRDVRAKLNDYAEKLRAASDVVERTTVLAPSEGIVNGLKFHTIGGVIAPGTPIMDIVPQSDRLVLEIRIQPTDIDVVKPGLESRVIFPAYKARRMPLFTGKVTQVSADAFNEQQGLQTISYYTARVEVDGDQLHTLEKGVNLYPGMPADVYIHTGSRSFIAYLLAPLTDSMEHAFKEE